MKLKWGYEISNEDRKRIEKDLFTDKVYIKLNENEPYFADNEKILEGFSDLDDLYRCGVAFAYISKKTLSNNKNKRTSLKCKPIGFPTKNEESKNERLVFQRCHLIGHQLFVKKNDKDNNKGANLKRIFTGTRFMNNVMFYYEKKIAKHVDNPENHVLYRVTPYFEGDNKLVYGVQMEAMFFNRIGKEDKNSSFNIFVYNKQPCVKINYETGKVLLEKMSNEEPNYVIDKKKNKYHIKGCASIWDFDQDRTSDSLKKSEVLKEGIYHPCGICDLGIKE